MGYRQRRSSWCMYLLLYTWTNGIRCYCTKNRPLGFARRLRFSFEYMVTRCATRGGFCSMHVLFSCKCTNKIRLCACFYFLFWFLTIPCLSWSSSSVAGASSSYSAADPPHPSCRWRRRRLRRGRFDKNRVGLTSGSLRPFAEDPNLSPAQVRKVSACMVWVSR